VTNFNCLLTGLECDLKRGENKGDDFGLFFEYVFHGSWRQDQSKLMI